MELSDIIVVQLLCIVLPAYAAWNLVPGRDTFIGRHLQSKLQANPLLPSCCSSGSGPMNNWIGILFRFMVYLLQAITRILAVNTFENELMPDSMAPAVGEYGFPRQLIYIFVGCETILTFLVFVCIFWMATPPFCIIAAIFAFLSFAVSVLAGIGMFVNSAIVPGVLQSILSVIFLVVAGLNIAHCMSIGKAKEV
jgi:hypothetical protein